MYTWICAHSAHKATEVMACSLVRGPAWVLKSSILKTRICHSLFKQGTGTQGIWPKCRHGGRAGAVQWRLIIKSKGTQAHREGEGRQGSKPGNQSKQANKFRREQARIKITGKVQGKPKKSRNSGETNASKIAEVLDTYKDEEYAEEYAA